MTVTELIERLQTVPGDQRVFWNDRDWGWIDIENLSPMPDIIPEEFSVDTKPGPGVYLE